MVVRGRVTSRGIRGSHNLIYEAGSLGRRVLEKGDDRGRLQVDATRLSSLSHVDRVWTVACGGPKLAVSQQDVSNTVSLRSAAIIPLMARTTLVYGREAPSAWSRAAQLIATYDKLESRRRAAGATHGDIEYLAASRGLLTRTSTSSASVLVVLDRTCTFVNAPSLQLGEVTEVDGTSSAPYRLGRSSLFSINERARMCTRYTGWPCTGPQRTRPRSPSHVSCSSESTQNELYIRGDFVTDGDTRL